MEIKSGDFESIESSESTFAVFFEKYAESVFEEARLFPVISSPRIYDTWTCWCADLDRVLKHEPKIPDGLDHFKRAGHLAFWLRRMSPVVDAEDIRQMYSYQETPENIALQDDFRKLLYAYGNEYLAFDLGYQFCRFYELEDGSLRASTLTLDEEYLRTVCHYFKFKTVSPHGIFLIYKSLFQRAVPIDPAAILEGGAE
jgi:hypothetical protein